MSDISTDITTGAPARLPALVDPVPALSAEQRDRAARQIRLPGFGEEAQRRLAAARVLVIGAGGLGSASVPYLVGAGIGTIGVVDDDVVELSNLHRQIAHGTDDLGRAKVDSLAETAARLDPGVRIVTHRERLTSVNALDVFADYDLVVDGSDNFATRYLSNDAAQLTGIPLVWGSILQFHGQVSVAWHEHGPGFRDLFPVPPAPEDVLSCGEGGVLPGLCGTIGSLLATEVMKLVTGVGEPLLGRVLVYDALAAGTREITYRRDPEAVAVTELIDYELFCAGGATAPEGVDAGAFAREYSGGFSGGAGGSDDGGPDPARPVLIDVRTAEVHAQRSIPGARLLPLDALDAAADQGPDAVRGLPALADLVADGTGPDVVVHCERDPRSIRAARILREAGFDRVRYLRGGIRALTTAAPELVKSNETSEHHRGETRV
ncbi:ThiF family adenylyltransferase [Citricoccus sp. NR2]|uniref:ThiF family adenylyltransferase n=1 Tax=Citricoccus sp. NR2 TaxID=3004095 RepID=UPI0022DE0AF4|nr:ThiF family adenylyltransferase [Citricoccus sp. NR2]WBL19842.1 ThiF family adenylyltransferase [Citricoccus sp. NR2]